MFQKGNKVNLGRAFSAEHRKNLSISKKGTRNPMFGKHFSEEHKKKIGKANKGKKKSSLSEETRKKISKRVKQLWSVPEYRTNMVKAHTGKKQTAEHRRKKSESAKKVGVGKWMKGRGGEISNLWKGGISFNPYPIDWTDILRESIRKRDSYACQLCGVCQDELNYKLHCHHIDYDKDNLDPNNLISLCRNCHLDTNSDRDYWKSYLSAFMRDNINNKLN